MCTCHRVGFISIMQCMLKVFLASAFLSGRRIHRKVVEFAGLFSLLFLFEYITFLLHPVVVNAAGHSPIYEIMIFIALAAILSPSHHKMQSWMMGKLTKRHHRKLTAAKTPHKSVWETERPEIFRDALFLCSVIILEEEFVRLWWCLYELYRSSCWYCLSIPLNQS